MKRTHISLHAATILLIGGLSNSVCAAEVDFTISNKSVYGGLTITPDSSKVNLSAGYLYHTDNRNSYHFDVHAQGQTVLGNLPTTAGIGFRGMGYKEGNIDGYGIGIGGYGDVNIPEVPGLSAVASFHYAPTILSFSDAENFKWFDAAISYRVIQNADVQVGYRYVHVAIDDAKDRLADSGLFLGLKMQF